MESHPGEHYRQILQEVLNKQCFGRIRREDYGEDKYDSDWVTDSD
jgi:hypothetical protein